MGCGAGLTLVLAAGRGATVSGLDVSPGLLGGYHLEADFPAGGVADVLGLALQNTLGDGKLASLAIANPAHAPYGRAAVAALTAMKLYDTLKPKLVIAENIAQTAQFVESGNAQLGLISLTSATTPHMQDIGSFVRIPPDTYLPIRQCAVVMKNSSHRGDAHAFLDWLRSPAIQHNLTQFGLDPVQ